MSYLDCVTVFTFINILDLSFLSWKFPWTCVLCHVSSCPYFMGWESGISTGRATDWGNFHMFRCTLKPVQQSPEFNPLLTRKWGECGQWWGGGGSFLRIANRINFMVRVTESVTREKKIYSRYIPTKRFRRFGSRDTRLLLLMLAKSNIYQISFKHSAG